MHNYIHVYFKLEFYMEANAINPDHTASNLGPYCLQYRLPKDISRHHLSKEVYLVMLNIFCPENVVCFLHLCIYSSALQTRFLHASKHYEL